MKVLNKQKNIAIILLASISIMFACQIDEPDIPPISDLDPGSIITVQELREQYQGQAVRFTEDHYFNVFARVTMAEESGNIYRSAFIEDHTGAINLRMVFAGDLNQGDSIRLNLKGTILDSYANMLQLDSVQGSVNIVKQKQGMEVSPTTVDFDDIMSGAYQARLVKLDNFQFVEGNVGEKIGDAIGKNTINRFVEDCQGRTVIIRTSGYADFANENIPQGNGSLVGVLGQFNNDWQLFIRHWDEVVMEEPRCDPSDALDLEPNTTVQEIRNLHSFGFHTITQDLVLEVVVGGNDASGNLYRQIMIQDDSGGIELKIHQNNLFNLFPVGQKLLINAKGLILGEFGGQVAIGGTIYDPGGGDRLGGIEGDQLHLHVFRVSGGSAPQATSVNMNSLNDADLYTYVRFDEVQFSEDVLGLNFAVAGTTSATNRDLNDCFENTIVVRTSSFSNFANTPLPDGNGSIKGILSKFNTTWQLLVLDIDDVNMEDERCGFVEPTDPIFDENFTVNLGGFVNINILGDQNWEHGEYDDGSAAMSGFDGGNNANENWLVSPAIDLSGKTNSHFFFREAINFGSGLQNTLKVFVSNNFNGTDVSSANWVEMTGFNRASGDSWTFINTGNIDISEFDGQSIHIAFKYVSTTAAAPNWQIGRIAVDAD